MMQQGVGPDDECRLAFVPLYIFPTSGRQACPHSALLQAEHQVRPTVP